MSATFATKFIELDEVSSFCNKVTFYSSEFGQALLFNDKIQIYVQETVEKNKNVCFYNFFGFDKRC